MLMAAAAYVTHGGLLAALGDDLIWNRIVNTGVAIAVAMVVYFAACRALKIEELDGFVRAFQRRLK